MTTPFIDSFAEDFPNAARKMRELGLGRNRSIPLSTKTPTGVLRLDAALRGGLPSGTTEIYGPDSVGKTALLGRIIAQAQARSIPVFLGFGDYLDLRYLSDLGVDTKELAVFPGGSSSFEENIYDIAGLPTPVLIAVDSLTSVRPSEDFDGAWNEFWFRILQRMKTMIRPGSAFVATSQVRNKNISGFSNKTKSTSVRLNDLFDCSLALERHSVGELDYTLVVDIKRSSQSPPGVVLELPSTKGLGIQYHLDAVRLAKQVGVLELRGPKMYFRGRCIGAGERGAADTVMRNQALYGELLEAVLG